MKAEENVDDKEAVDMCQAIKEMIEDGKCEGKAEGKAEGILDLLRELGEVPENLSARILSQHDLAVLTDWLKLAARSGSVEAFAQKIK